MAQDGHVSFWLPWEFCGMPHMADIQRQVFYPPTAIFYLLPTDKAMVGFIWFHFAAASLLMFAFLRHMRSAEPVGCAAATCGAVVYAYSSFPLLHSSQLPQLSTYTWIPGVLLALERTWERPSWSWTAIGSVLVALMLLGGAPQAVFIGACLLTAYTLLLAVTQWRAAAALSTLAMPLLGGALAALQLLPTLELLRWSSRQEVSSAYSTIGTADPEMLLTLLRPYAWGNPHENSWLRATYTFHEECLYLGILTLMLAGAAVLGGRSARARTIFFAVTSVAGVLLALGNHVAVCGLPLHDLLRKIVPMFGKFRVPARWMILTTTAMAPLAALGMQALQRWRPSRNRFSLASLLPLHGCGLVATAIGGLLWRFRAAQCMPLEVRSAVLMLAASSLGVLLLYLWAGRGALMPTLVTMLLTADLVVFAVRYITWSPTPDPLQQYPVLQSARAVTGRVISHTRASVPTALAAWCPPLGIANLQGTNPLFLQRYIDYLYYSQAGRLPPSDDTVTMQHNGFFLLTPQYGPMTRMLNLRAVLNPLTVQGDGLGQAAPPMRVTAVDDGLGVVYAANQVVVLPNRQLRLEYMARADFLPTRTVVFERDPGIKLAGSDQLLGQNAVVKEYQPDGIVVELTTSSAAFAVFSEIYYPGWRCQVDGKEVEILQANDIFRAVPVSAGKHLLVMTLHPTSFRVGLLITMVTMALMGTASLCWR